MHNDGLYLPNGQQLVNSTQVLQCNFCGTQFVESSAAKEIHLQVCATVRKVVEDNNCKILVRLEGIQNYLSKLLDAVGSTTAVPPSSQ